MNKMTTSKVDICMDKGESFRDMEEEFNNNGKQCYVLSNHIEKDVNMSFFIVGQA